MPTIAGTWSECVLPLRNARDRGDLHVPPGSLVSTSRRPQQFIGTLGFSKQILAVALDEDGNFLYGDSRRFSWSSSAPDVVSVDQEGTICVGAGGVYAVDPGGTVLWNYEPCCTVLGTPLLGADGTVYIGSAAVDAEGGHLWDSGIGGHLMGSPAIGIDGGIISTSFSGSSVDNFQGTIRATLENGSANGGFAGSPWPTDRGNRANNGRAGG
jgi:hypothetical protein